MADIPAAPVKKLRDQTGAGVMEFYRRQAADAEAAKIPVRPLTDANGGVRLHAPPGSNTVYLGDGRKLQVDANGSIIVSASDAAALRGAGFRDQP